MVVFAGAEDKEIGVSSLCWGPGGTGRAKLRGVASLRPVSRWDKDTPTNG